MTAFLKKKKKKQTEKLFLATCLPAYEKCATKKQMGQRMQSRRHILYFLSLLLMASCGAELN